MEYQNCVNINASEAIIPSEVFMAIKTEPETLIEHGEVPVSFRSKCTNKLQLQHLLSLMEQNPEIARGFFKGDRLQLQQFWRRAEDELNSLGPPNKNSTEWKKVWIDQKRYVRQKAAQNLQQKKGAGGGPNKDYKFSPIEQTIFDLIGMKTSIESVTTSTLALSSPKNIEEHPDIMPDMDGFDVSMQDGNFNESRSHVVASKTTVTSKSEAAKFLSHGTMGPKQNGTPKSTLNSKAEAAKFQSDMQFSELSLQKGLLDTVKEAVVELKEQKQAFTNICGTIDSMRELQEKHFQVMEKLKKDEIEELRRHHSFMEEIRAKEVEHKLDKNRLNFKLED